MFRVNARTVKEMEGYATSRSKLQKRPMFVSNPEIMILHESLIWSTAFWSRTAMSVIVTDPTSETNFRKLIVKDSQIYISRQRSYQGHLSRSSLESTKDFHFTVRLQDFLSDGQRGRPELGTNDHIANVLGILRDRPQVNANDSGRDLREIIGLVKVSIGELSVC